MSESEEVWKMGGKRPKRRKNLKQSRRPKVAKKVHNLNISSSSSDEDEPDEYKHHEDSGKIDSMLKALKSKKKKTLSSLSGSDSASKSDGTGKSKLPPQSCEEPFTSAGNGINSASTVKSTASSKTQPSEVQVTEPKTTSKRHTGKSQVWLHFEKAKRSNIAKCRYCTKQISQNDGSTGNLLYHLRTAHDLIVKKGPLPTAERKETLRQTALSFDSKKWNSESEIYTELVCRDRFSVLGVTQSRFIHHSICQQGFTATKRPNTVMSKVTTTIEKEKQIMKDENAENTEKGERYSITFDEWTSVKNRRHININVHKGGGKVENLGMVRVRGSQTAESIVKLVSERLTKFGLDIKRIVGNTTDGASIMVKFGNIVNGVHQNCLAHAIHLAVEDILYEKKKVKKDQALEAAGDGVADDSIEDEMYEADSEGDSDFGESEDEEMLLQNPDYVDSFAWTVPARHGRASSILKDEIRELKPEYKVVIDKVRAIARKFRKSPNLNDFLQVRVKKKLGHELKLQLDVKTRWNSLLKMITVYARLHDVVTPFLKECCKYTSAGHVKRSHATLFKWFVTVKYKDGSAFSTGTPVFL
jgi:hypothetical protein